MRKPTLSLRVADEALRARVLEAVAGQAILVEARDADVAATDADPAPGEFAVAEVGEDAFPTVVRRAVELAARLDARQSTDLRDLIGSAVHDIRNPLGAVTVNLAFALPLVGSNAELRDALTDARDAAARVARQIDDCMFLEHALAGSLRVQHEAIDCARIFDGLLLNAATAARGRGVTISTTNEGELSVRGDVAVLTRAMTALLDLALKYSQRGAEISTGSERDGDRVVLYVRHDARTPEQHPPLSAWLANRRRPGEIGFPLAIAAAAVELHNGELRVESSKRWPTELRIVLPT